MTGIATTTKHMVQWRAFIGPPWRPSTDAAFWDWSALTLAAYTPAPAATTLAHAVAAGDVVADLTDASAYPTAGGVWLMGAAGQAAEYVTYTGKSSNQLTGLTRAAVGAECSGIHSAGAVVRFWYPLTTDDGKLTVHRELDDALAATSWTASISGVTFPQAALKNAHLVLVQLRWWVTGDVAWGDWENALIGWLQNPHGRSDATAENAWTAQIVSVAGMAGLVEIAGVHAGAVTVDNQISASATSELGNAYMLAANGESAQAAPDLGAGQAVDGDVNTLWLSDHFVGTANKPASTADVCLDQIHIAPYAGQGPGYRWLQFPVRSNSLGWGAMVINTAGYWPVTAGHGQYVWDNDNRPEVGDGQHVIFCENELRFREENPNPGENCQIIEIGAKAKFARYNGDADGEPAPTYTSAQYWDSFAPAGGACALVVWDGSLAINNYGQVLWGTATLATIGSAWSADWKLWTGASLAAIPAGYTIRRQWGVGSALAATGWTVDNVTCPGYFLNGTDAEGWTGDLPSLGLTLTAGYAVTDASPGAGETLHVSLPDGPGTDGLAASGIVLVGAEQISYSAKTADYGGLVVTARGAASTTAAAHVAGDAVVPVVGGVAIDAPPVAAVIVTRKTGVPVVKDYIVRGSTYRHARGIRDDGYSTDYVTLETVTGNSSASHTTTLGTPARYAKILVEITAMGTDPYRPGINSLSVTLDSTCYRADTHFAGTSANLQKQMLLNAGVPTGAITAVAGTTTLTNHTTARDWAWRVVADLADYAGNTVTVGLDSKIVIAPSVYWGSAGLPDEAANWTTLTASAIEPDWQHGLSVSQVELTWLTAAGATGGIEVYPAVPNALGGKTRLDPLVYADASAAQAAAQKRYWQARRPCGVLIEAAGAPWEVEPNQCVGLAWALSGEMLPLDRTYLVTSVDHQIADFALTTAINLLQISREDEL